jgi:hypothetical protein
MSTKTRRDCLRLLGAGVSAGAAMAANKSSSARSAARVIGANERINVGMIGVGGKGTSHLRALVAHAAAKNDIQITGVADVYTKRKDRARDLAKMEQKQIHHDYHDLLARPDVDAVYIATPDHWHARMALDAMAAGKDVYLEKPMTYTIDEARQLMETSKRLERVLQIGSQHLSDLGADHVQPEFGEWGVELLHRCRRNGAEHRLDEVAGLGAETRVLGRALFPLAEVLGLFGRHRH